ncbi:acyl-CoA thioesterase [Bacillus sp. HNG]|uniref:acyl-CoA thioesterase n=1 Tax=Bacillaceae TaxID=186817 RepID=UPI000E2F5C68|nr:MULTISPECIES: acyl-CoA thioesterase [Bacillaceae]MDR4889160.1 acyl-CoA thioesterase [Fredinandcohnia sp. QZ13]RFB17733.1 acyl-CoA thioesterase [Bacillus sp. HNG]
MKHITYIDDIETWENAFDFFQPIQVRFSETDMFGHLNNTVPFTYFEEARIQYFNKIGFMQKWTDKSSEAIPVVASQQCDYLKQVFFGEQLKLYVKINQLGNSSMDIHYMAKDKEGSICFVGRSTLVQMSKRTGKGEPWSDEMKHMLKKHLTYIV